jgi:peptidoglycan/LPS O-acetylase OafA/YrhL
LNKTNRLDHLDALRGVAIVSVFIFHALYCGYSNGELPWGHYFRSFNVGWSFLIVSPFTIGSAGVALFFALSGFCIHASFMKRPEWKDFTLRRFWRIYPPYCFALCLFAFIKSSSGWQVFSHALLIHNLFSETFTGINPNFWSIAVEVQLYAIYPLLIFLACRIGWGRSVVLLAVIEAALRIVSCFYAPRWLRDSPFTFWFSWSVGAYVAQAYVKGQRLPFTGWPTGWILFAAIAATMAKATNNFAFPLFALFGATWIANSTAHGTLLSSNIWLARHLRKAGLWSYSLYLIHHPIIAMVGAVLPHSKTNFFHHALFRFIILLCLWPVVLVLSGWMYRLIEKPSMRIGHSKSELFPLREFAGKGIGEL